MDRQERNDRLRQLEEAYSDYEVRDPQGEKIGKVDDLFVDENDRPEYIGVKMGFLGLSGTTLIPAEITTTDEECEVIEVAAEKDKVKEAPGFDDDQEITPEFEREIHEYYELDPADGIEREPYGAYTETESEATLMGERNENELRNEDEFQVQRTEEELRAGTREREAGHLNVRKRVRTERERLEVPTRHEEVSVERVPVDEEASGAEIGEDEVSVPVVEEEVVVEKRPVVKEELRIRKEVVEDEEVVEEDVRKEEVDIDDETERGHRDA